MERSNLENLVTIYVSLLDEGTPCSRPTLAESVGDGLFRLLETPNYDPQDEHWEFPPGSVVRTITKKHERQDYLLAIKA